MKRSRGKTSIEAQSFTSALDETDYLQVYIHGFEDWDSDEIIPATFTPLTINDIDVTELTMYDSLGNTIILEVDTIPPAYPIAIVGLNERMAMESEFTDSNRMGLLGKTSGEPMIYFTELNLDKSAWRYEPWWMGTNAEIYFYFYDPQAPDTSEWGVGYFAPFDNHVNYKCWEKKRWYKWKQTKPWRTINLNTYWYPSDILDDNNKINMKIIEYDPLSYDLGNRKIYNLALVTTAGSIAYGAYMAGNLYACAFYALCATYLYHVENDDRISTVSNFHNIVSQANNDQGDVIEYGNSDFKVKIVVKK